ncbi:MAG: periplasmic heavy metal sensor [bacterium]|nr:periplasmic heavy metal sensor [bacterium]
MKRHIFSKRSFAVLTVLAAFLLVGASWAQPAPDESDGPGAPPPDQPPRWEREKMETVIIGKFATELDLTPEQAEKFFPVFRQFQNEAEGLMREQHKRRAEMDELSHNPEADKTQVDNLLTQQMESERRISDMKRKLLTDVGAFLTPQQVSRCSILMDELPRRIHQFIEERRGARLGDEKGRDRPRGRRD